MKNIIFSLILLGFSFPIFATDQLASRRYADPDALGEATISFEKKEEEPVVDQNALRSYRHLHRQALLAFHLEKYELARQCFALALQSNPKSSDLLLDYALFSLVVPVGDGQTLTRAQNLVNLVQTPKAQRDPRYTLVKVLFDWKYGEKEKALQGLVRLKKTPLHEITDQLTQHILADARALNPLWVANVLHLRKSPKERRGLR